MKSISCKCITYGRVDTLQESLFSFLNQNYEGKKELIIVNDYPHQNLIFDHPEVKIFNLKQTFETIGDKENFAVDKCEYDTIAVWDDDDIALDNHLDNINKYFLEDSDLLHWAKGVLFNNSSISSITSLGNSGIVYSKKIWKLLGGHVKENAGYDMAFVLKIKKHSKNIVLANPEDSNVSWFYCWENRSYHMSGMGADTSDRPNIIQRHSEHIENLRLSEKIPTGNIYLEPKWNQDYKLLLESFLNRNNI